VAGEELFQFVAVFVLTVSRACTPKCRRFGTQACPTSLTVEKKEQNTGHELKKGVMSRHWMVGEEMNGVEFSFIS
jgi:hypothetical protein